MSHPDDVAYDDEPLPAQPARLEPPAEPMTQAEIREEAEAEHAAHNQGHPEFELSGTPEGPCCRIGSDEALDRTKREASEARFVDLNSAMDVSRLPGVEPGSLRLVEVPCPWCSKGEPHPTGFGAPHTPSEEQAFDGVDALRYMLAGMAPKGALWSPGFGSAPESVSDEPEHSVPGGRVRTFTVPSVSMGKGLLAGAFAATGGFVLVVDLLTEAGLTHEIEHAWMEHGRKMGALTTIISAEEIKLPGTGRR